MSVKVYYEIQGFKELEMALKDLRNEMKGDEGNLVAKALKKASYPVWREAQAKAPVSDAEITAATPSGQANMVSFEGGRVRVTGVKKPKDHPGRLRRAIKRVYHRNPRGWSELVGVGVDHGKGRDDPKGAYYGKFVEFGTRRMKAQPFLRPALESNRAKFVQVFGSELGNGITKAARSISKKYPDYGSRRYRV